MLDHLVVVAFALGFPLVSTPLYLARRPALEGGDRSVRRREYVETIAWLSAMGVASVAAWVWAGRDLVDLGLGLDGSWRTAGALLLAGLFGALLFAQVAAVRRDPATRAAARAALAPVREYMPRGEVEMRLFRGVSLAAGIGEELFYRGFLIWYLAQAMPLVAAVGVSSVLFGLAHVMHGVQATVRSTGTGVVLAGLYLLSGSLWASMVLHAAIDLASGETGRAAFVDAH